MSGNGNVYVTWPRLLAFLGAMAGLAWGISTYQVGAVDRRMEDHQRQPHAGSVRQGEIRLIEQELNRIARDVAEIRRYLMQRNERAAP